MGMLTGCESRPKGAAFMPLKAFTMLTELGSILASWLGSYDGLRGWDRAVDPDLVTRYAGRMEGGDMDTSAGMGSG